MLQGIGGLLLFFGFITAILDMGMNGSRYAYWAPWGLTMCIVGGAMMATGR